MKCYKKNVQESLNKKFVCSSSKWIERPPIAIPGEFLRDKINSQGKSFEKISRLNSPKMRKHIDQTRIQSQISA